MLTYRNNIAAEQYSYLFYTYKGKLHLRILMRLPINQNTTGLAFLCVAKGLYVSWGRMLISTLIHQKHLQIIASERGNISKVIPASQALGYKMKHLLFMYCHSYVVINNS